MVKPDRITSHTIRKYYDQNTRLFLAWGSSPRAYTIHRSIWAPGITSLDQALDYTNHLILQEIHRLAQDCSLNRLSLADLGCGVGGSLFFLLPRLNIPATCLGLTISPTQASLAVQRARRLGVEQQVHFVEADFLFAPLVTGLDMIWSVEAFLHAETPDLYFAEVSRLLKPGGRLALCDDFLAETRCEMAVRNRKGRERWLQAYQQGWHVPSLIPLSQAEEMASERNLALIRNLNLTPYLRLRALPDWLAGAILAIGQRIPVRHAILPSMLGSMALQQSLKRGWIEYHFLVFEKRHPGSE